MATTLSVGHVLDMGLEFLDQRGNPMLTTPAPDAAPAWAGTTPATETLAVAASGLTCEGTSVAAGTDEVTVTLTVGGVAFSAVLDVTVTAAVQVLTSVAITTAVA